MNFNIENFMQTLPVMGKGMFGIFIVTLVIVTFMVVLNKITNK